MTSSDPNRPFIESLEAPSPIPVYHETPEQNAQYPSPSMVTGLEKQMDTEVAEVLNELSDNIRSRTQSSFHIRPLSSDSSSDRHHRRRTPGGVTPHGTPPTRMGFPEIEVLRREDSILDSSVDSLEEDGRRQYYVDCPETGGKQFRMVFDIKGYDPSNICVKVLGSRLVVQAVQRGTVDGKKSTTEFCRKVKLPGDVDTHKLRCHCQGDKLLIQAPLQAVRIPRPVPWRSVGQSPSMPSFPSTHNSTNSLYNNHNVPQYRETASGLQLLLLADVGRLFQAEDVLVKVKGHRQLSVTASRDQKDSKSSLNASVVREFELEQSIRPETLRAGLTSDGVLKVTAEVMQDTDIKK